MSGKIIGQVTEWKTSTKIPGERSRQRWKDRGDTDLEETRIENDSIIAFDLKTIILYCPVHPGDRHRVTDRVFVLFLARHLDAPTFRRTYVRESPSSSGQNK